MSFDDRLGDYNDVASRMREFFERYPDGRLRPAGPWRVETIGDRAFICYEAAAYRTADDPNPGVGTAWEPFPGRTPYTKDSELMNAETSAWGRAILAVGAADTKRGIASREEVRNRQAERDYQPSAGELRATIARVGSQKSMSPGDITVDFRDWTQGEHQITTEDTAVLAQYLQHLTGAAS